MKTLVSLVCMMIFFSSFSQERDLDYFINKGQKNSPLLVDYKNQIHSTTLDSLLNLATRKPQVNATVFGNYAPVIADYGYDNALSNGQTLSGLVGVNKKIVSKSAIANQLETFKLTKDGLATNRKIAVKDLSRAITSQYISASATSEQIEYNKKTTQLLKEESIILKKLTQNSVYKQTDYLLFSATVKQQELVLLQLHQQYQNDLGLLNYLAGETDTTNVYLKKPTISLKSISTNEKNIFLKTFEIDSLKLKNQNKLIDFAYKPNISLLADAGYLSTFANLPYKNFGFSVGFGILVPIYDGNQRSLQHQKNTDALATNLAYKTNYNRQYKQQLLILNQKLKQASEVDIQLQSQLKIAEALIEANKKLLVTGDAQITEFILAISSYINIQNAISQNHINKLQVINDINYWSFND